MNLTIRKTFYILSLFLLCPLAAFEDYCFPVPVSGELHLAFDDFRGISDGSWNGNTGALAGANFGFGICDYFSAQAGGSFGVYDWYGRGPVGDSNDKPQQQGFLTVGLFREAQCHIGVHSALVYDVMFNKNFGVFSHDFILSQCRFQLGYEFFPSQEVGFWGTLNTHTASESTEGISVKYRAISQASLYWRKVFENNAQGMIWVGLPFGKSLLLGKGRPGLYVFGASFRAPLNDCLNVFGHGAYMGPRGRKKGIPAFINYDANVCIGLSYAFGQRGADFGSCSLVPSADPYMPVANNSVFIVDTSYND